MSTKIVWIGDKKLEFDVKNSFFELQKAIGRKMTHAVTVTHDESVRQAPIDTGQLRHSSQGRVGGVEVSQGSEGGVAVQTVVDGSDLMKGKTLTGIVAYKEDYAVIQHEREDFQHPRGGNAKYLERPVLARRKVNMDTILSAAQEAASKL